MAIPAILFLGSFLAATLVLVASLFGTRRSPVCIAGGLPYVVAFAGPAYYSVIESGSLVWALGYSVGTMAFMSLIALNCFGTGDAAYITT